MQRIGTSGTPGKNSSLPVTHLLRFTALFFAAGLLLHVGDHLRRGLDAVTLEVLWAGNVTTVVAVAAIALAFMGHRSASLIAVAVGFSQALGVVAVHLLPDWGVFSDSLSGGGVDAFTWVAVLIEIAGAAAFGAAGLYTLRRFGRR